MSAGAFKRSARNRTTVSTWERGYRGRFVVRRDWRAVAELAALGLYAATLIALTTWSLWASV